MSRTVSSGLKFMPLWWWSNETKKEFKEKEQIKYSDCYEVYGMKRTGCCGCPFNLNIADDLQIMAAYEPKLLKAVMHTFGESYRLMDEFGCRRKKCLPESIQLPLSFEKE
jgi:3'-phosphoadenosine 5'-phosphosulfate sulfotransferase (PAPS reductase)/FAD synthetase